MLRLQASIYLILSALNKYLWRTRCALDIVLGLKEVTFSEGEGQVQNTVSICSVAMRMTREEDGTLTIQFGGR